MGDLVDLDAHRPHLVGMIECPECDHFWVAVVDARIEPDTRLECPDCHEQSGEFLGELPDDD